MKNNILSLFIMTLALLLPITTVHADFTDYTFESTFFTEQGAFDMILSFDSSSEQTTFQINGLEIEDPHRPGIATQLPDFTIVGGYQFDQTTRKLSFDNCWTGDQEVPDFPVLSITSMCAATVGEGLQYIPDYNHFAGYLLLTIGKEYVTPIGPVAEEANETYNVFLHAPPPTSSVPGVALSYLNSTQWEHSEGNPELFDTPTFSEEDGLGLFVNDPNRTFGYWQTREILDAPAAGRYTLRIYLTPSNPSGKGRLPELRARVFTGDNSQSQMAVFAQTTSSTEVPEYIEMVWYSDGITPWRVAIDLLSFVPDYAGGYVVTRITNTRLFMDPGTASMYLDPPDVTISQGETATLELYIRAVGTPVGGYTTLVLYNPLDLQITTLLQGRDPYLGYPMLAEINNQMGVLVLSSAQGTAMDRPIGIIHVATIEFTGNELGSHYIELAESEVANVSAQSMMLMGQTGATINVVEPEP